MSWRAGDRIAGYELVEEMGRGAMGVVFRAVQLATGREVALKGLLENDEEALARFAREVAAQAAVDGHRNVVRVYEAGQARGGAYLALELVRGGNLEQRLRQGRLPVEEAARVVEELSRGMAHVHAHGILHRDLKPENVLFDERGTPKLVDFGLARLDRARRMTLTGSVVGTPAFMAPEQALGLNDEVDQRTDVYGLGAILYACLTGVAPFRGESVTDVLSRVATEDPERPSELRPEVDRELEAICLRALARERGDRFVSADALGDALAEWARLAADADGRRSTPQVAPARLLLALAAGAVLGFLGGILAGSSSVSEPPVSQAVPSPDRGPDATGVESPPEPEPEPAPPPPTAPVVRRVEPKVGALVLAPVQGDEEERARLAWIAEVLEDGRVMLLAGRQIVGPLSIPQGGLRGDGFGVGARALAVGERGLRPCRVIRRRGPLGLVELTGGDRRWMPVVELTLVGAGVPVDPDPQAEVVLAPWSDDDTLYPAVVIAQDPQDTDWVRVGYLDSDSAWVRDDTLRPLPVVSERVHYKDAKGKEVPAVVRSYPRPWLVEVVRIQDRERVVIDLHNVKQRKADRAP